MSHACCLVILNEFEDLPTVMEPYEECPDNDDYLEFEDITDDVLKEYKDYVDEGKEEVNFTEFLDRNGYVEQDGRYGYKSNPNGHWDWYEVGGRWSSYLKLKDKVKYPNKIFIQGKLFEGYETHCDECLKEDFDYEGMKKLAYDNAVKSWEEHEKNPDKDAYWEYGIYKDETKETFLNRIKNENLFYAIIKDGEWFSRGAMGWFGISRNDKDNWVEIEKQLINEADKKARLVLVDFHI